MQKMHNALGAALRSASARSSELIEKMDKEWCIKMANLEGDSEIGAGILAADPDFGKLAARKIQEHTKMAGDLCTWKHVPLYKAQQEILRKNLRDSYPIWVEPWEPDEQIWEPGGGSYTTRGPRRKK